MKTTPLPPPEPEAPRAWIWAAFVLLASVGVLSALTLVLTWRLAPQIEALAELRERAASCRPSPSAPTSAPRVEEEPAPPPPKRGSSTLTRHAPGSSASTVRSLGPIVLSISGRRSDANADTVPNVTETGDVSGRGERSTSVTATVLPRAIFSRLAASPRCAGVKVGSANSDSRWATACA